MDIQQQIARLAQRVDDLEKELQAMRQRVCMSDDGSIELRGKVRITTAEGRPVVVISGGEVSILTLLNTEGNNAFVISSADEGQVNCFQMLNKEKKIVSVLQTVGSEEGAIFTLHGKKNRRTLALSVLGEDGKITITDSEGRFLFSQPSE